MVDRAEQETMEPECVDVGAPKLLCSIELLLPGHRGPYALNDFRKISDRVNERAIVDYLYRAASQIRSKGSLELVLRLPEGEARDRTAEQITERAYRDMLEEWVSDAASSSIIEVPKAIALAVIGTLILLISYFMEHEGGEGTLLAAAAGIFQVGAWVSLWTAFSSLFFQATSSWRRASVLRKVAMAPMRFLYADIDPNEQSEQPATGIAPKTVGQEVGMH